MSHHAVKRALLKGQMAEYIRPLVEHDFGSVVELCRQCGTTKLTSSQVAYRNRFSSHAYMDDEIFCERCDRETDVVLAHRVFEGWQAVFDTTDGEIELYAKTLLALSRAIVDTPL